MRNQENVLVLRKSAGRQWVNTSAMLGPWAVPGGTNANGDKSEIHSRPMDNEANKLKLLTTSTTVLTVPDTAVVKVHLDSSSAKQLAENEGYTGKTRHIGIQFYFVRDLVETGIISLTWVPSHQQLADVFTKPLDEAAFVRFQSAVMFRFEVRRVS